MNTPSVLFAAVGDSGIGTGTTAAEETTSADSAKNASAPSSGDLFVWGKAVLPCEQRSDNPFYDLQFQAGP
jgi:hypothetical protein